MKVHDFTLVLTSDPNEDESDRVYETFNDGTIVTIAGVPRIHFHREAASLEEAIRTAIGDLQRVGFHAERLEIERDALDGLLAAVP